VSRGGRGAGEGEGEEDVNAVADDGDGAPSEGELAYGGGDSCEGAGEMRERVNEFECEGRLFLMTDSAREKKELLWAGGICEVECGERMKSVI